MWIIDREREKERRWEQEENGEKKIKEKEMKGMGRLLPVGRGRKLKKESRKK
jgi:hypothetical protein